jgi:hypothetical protein
MSLILMRRGGAVSGGGGGGFGTWAANRPSGYTTTISDYAFSDAPTATDAEVSLGGGWSQIYGSTLTQFNQSEAPVSPNLGLQWNYPSSGTGGTSVGNVFYPLFGVSELYVAMAIWHDANFEINPTSTKLFYWEGGNILNELNLFSNLLVWYIGALDDVYTCNIATPTEADFLGKWAQIEHQIVRGASGSLRTWLNGTLVSEHTGINVPSSSNEVKIDSTWGGGGTHTRACQRRIDHVLLASP